MKPYYQDPFCTIYHGDCREILPSIPMVDLVLTDPPYGLGESMGKNKSRGDLSAAKDYGFSTWDIKPIDSNLMNMVITSGKCHVIFGGNYYPLPTSQCWFVWDKDNGNTDFADCELAWTSLNGAVRLFKYRWNGMLKAKPEVRFHPTQKPLDLIKWCITKADQKQKTLHKTILDPFMGSGTTLRAAKDMQRHAIGIELEEKYCEVAARRLQQEVLQLEVLP